jgi:mRNA interferase RelE/StbE
VALRVELLDEAVGDLLGYAESGNLKLFLKKLVELEAGGPNLGLPLGRNLRTWRKIVVGNRDWRIVFQISEDEEVATVCVIGDRNDEQCYEEATQRVEATGDADGRSLAEAMLDLMGSRKERKKAAKRRR